MDTLPPPQTFGTTSKELNIGQIFTIMLLCLIVVLMAAGVYYFHTQSSRVPEVTKTINSSKSEKISPTAIIVITPTQAPQESKVDIAKLAKENIENNSEFGLAVDTLDVSPSGSSAAFLGHGADWKKYGLYLYNLGDKKLTAVFELNESLTGRGGIYTDNIDVKFSQDGNVFFANKTGTNFPQFIIADSQGTILYKSSDLGNATWVANDKVLYIKTLDKNPEIFDTATKKSSPTNLPKEVFHLVSNTSGTNVLALTVAKKPLQCQSFDLSVFAYPKGNLMKSEPNVDITAFWEDDSRIAVDKVMDCKKNTGESMMPYSTVTERQEIVVQ